MQDPDTWVNSVLRESGLPTPNWQLYPWGLLGIARLEVYLPLVFTVLVLAKAIFQTAGQQSMIYRDGLLVIILLATAIALPVFLQSWPQWLTPPAGAIFPGGIKPSHR